MKMSDFFKIYVDRLKNGASEHIEDELSPEFLGLKEDDVQFKKRIAVEGKAYLVDEHLVICLSAEMHVLMPCAICNEHIDIPLTIENFTHTVPIEELKEPIYDFSTALREQILIELPHFVECSGGCSERKNMESFLKKDKKTDKDETYFPFSDLE